MLLPIGNGEPTFFVSYEAFEYDSRKSRPQTLPQCVAASKSSWRMSTSTGASFARRHQFELISRQISRQPQPPNAASFRAGPVAPGEIVTTTPAGTCTLIRLTSMTTYRRVENWSTLKSCVADNRAKTCLCRVRYGLGPRAPCLPECT